MLKIYCKNTGTYKEFQEGTSLLEMLPQFDFEKPYPIVSAKVNNVSQGLKYRAFNNRDVEFLDYRTYSGRNVYSRSLCFLLCKAVQDLFPGGHVVMRRPISKGFFCVAEKGDGTPLGEADIDAVRDRMTSLVEQDIQFRRHDVQVQEAIDIFSSLGQTDKVKLLRSCGDVYVKYYSLDGTPDYYCDVLVPSTGYLKIWSISPYNGGLLL
ncbi:MAG: nucleoside kinase, partial [Candidatus Cryptobacteroides sp.]